MFDYNYMKMKFGHEPFLNILENYINVMPAESDALAPVNTRVSVAVKLTI